MGVLYSEIGSLGYEAVQMDSRQYWSTAQREAWMGWEKTTPVHFKIFFMGLLCSRHSHFCKLFQPLHRPWRFFFFFFLKKSVSQCASASEIIIASVVRLVVVEHVPSECPLHPVGLGLLRKSPWSLAPKDFFLIPRRGR